MYASIFSPIENTVFAICYELDIENTLLFHASKWRTLFFAQIMLVTFDVCQQQCMGIVPSEILDNPLK